MEREPSADPGSPAPVPGRVTPAARVGLAAGGIVLLLLALAVASHSSKFQYGVPPPGGAIPLFVALQVVAGLVYLAVILPARRGSDGPGVLIVIAVGLLLRIVAWASQPILEDDFHRYLWDGAAVSAGVSPYRYSPTRILDGSTEVPDSLRLVALSGGPLVARINHPDLTTIYPPVAQAAFFVSHLASPFSLDAWKTVLLMADLVALALTWQLLVSRSLPRWLIAVYWWNPLLIKETYNSAHMDVLLLPFLLGAVLMRIRGRPLATAAGLALATGVKLWPVLLAPLLLAPWLRRSGRNALAPLLYVALTGALLAPMLVGPRGQSGLLSFAGRWEMNDGLFAALAWLAGFASASGPAVVRAAVAAALAALAVVVAIRDPGSPSALVRGALAITGTLLLASPAQFPWYFIWALPFLAVVPFPPLLALTAALPLYYLRFHFLASGSEGLFDNGIVFLEWVPIWGLLLHALLTRGGRPRVLTGAA